MKKKPVINKLYKKMKAFRENYIFDIPDDKKKYALEALEDLIMEALEHGAEGTVRGLKK